MSPYMLSKMQRCMDHPQFCHNLQWIQSTTNKSASSVAQSPTYDGTETKALKPIKPPQFLGGYSTWSCLHITRASIIASLPLIHIILKVVLSPQSTLQLLHCENLKPSPVSMNYRRFILSSHTAHQLITIETQVKYDQQKFFPAYLFSPIDLNP